MGSLSIAQSNLIPNPSFENIVNCPTMESQIYLAEPWFQPILCSWGGNVDICSSSDLFNSCHIPNPPFANVDVPINDFGFQFARTGNGYAGIGFWVDNGGRERIETPLISPLIKDEIYCVKMFVVNKRMGFDGSLNLTSTANLQFLFTIDSLYDNNDFGMNYYTPSVVNPDNSIIDDTLNWTEISGCYKSIGGEKFLTIGNFYNNVNSNVSDPSGDFAYYFIDDISVIKSDGVNCNCDEFIYSNPDLILPNVLTPNDDSINDFWSPKFISADEYVVILNRWGEEMITLNQQQPSWDGYFKNIKCVNGVYFYKAWLRGEFKIGFIHLIN